MVEHLKGLLAFFQDHFLEIGEQTLEHLGITLVSLFLAALVGISTGVILTRRQHLAQPVLAFVNIVQTIPSLALLGFLLPFFGIGVVPAIIALFLYALLPIVRNTYTGIIEVDPAVKEAAKGMGMSDSQVLMKVDLPLAVPVIFAGIRTAMVLTVGIATLTALIAAGGLGEFIFRGIAVNNVYMILAGAIPASLLAIVLDAILGLLQSRIQYLVRPLLYAIGVLLLVLAGVYLFKPSSNTFVGGFPSEFMERKDGLKGLKAHYNMDFESVEMEIGLMYQALQDEQVDLISGFSTDGRIEANDLITLEDDLGFFPPYECAANVYGETLRKYPELTEIFDKVAGAISDQDMIAMNFRVTHFKESPAKVAEDYLTSRGFALSLNRTPRDAVDIVIGSKNFTESFVLAELFKLLIENSSSLKVEVKSSFGGTKLVFEALRRGDVDIYPEYSGTGLLVILQPEQELLDQVLMNPDSVFKYVSSEYNRRYDIKWLSPLGFNNTHAMLMRREQAEDLNIKSISDLKNYLRRLN